MRANKADAHWSETHRLHYVDGRTDQPELVPNESWTSEMDKDNRITQLEQELAEAEAKHAETIGEIFRNEVVPLKQQLAEARKDTERLDYVFKSDWLLIDFEYWNASKEMYDTRMVNSRESLDEAICELRRGGDSAMKGADDEA